MTVNSQNPADGRGNLRLLKGKKGQERAEAVGTTSAGQSGVQEILEGAGTPPQGRPEMGIDTEIAENWELWSAHLGRALMPTLRELHENLKGFKCAMICTADGFNLCTLGLDQTGVLRLAALTSSMHSIADAVTQAVHDDAERRIDVLTLTDQDSTVVVLAIRDAMLGKLLLWVATEHDTLGALLVHARRAAAQIRQFLEVDNA